MDYKSFISAMDDLAMGIGDIADQLGISIEDVQKWETLDSVPQEAIDLYEFEKENQIIED
jgi:DNA-binding transcriptional regulator YiaG|tara:strand:+ start:616 stop:795 length:180 start_codon:yes stop_codon:yes gene_type:complete